jgi:hypothetical protein
VRHAATPGLLGCVSRGGGEENAAVMAMLPPPSPADRRSGGLFGSEPRFTFSSPMQTGGGGLSGSQPSPMAARMLATPPAGGFGLPTVNDDQVLVHTADYTSVLRSPFVPNFAMESVSRSPALSPLGAKSSSFVTAPEVDQDVYNGILPFFFPPPSPLSLVIYRASWYPAHAYFC